MKHLVTIACLIGSATIIAFLGFRNLELRKELEKNATFQISRDSVILKDALEIQRQVDERGIEHVIYKEVKAYSQEDIKNMPVAGFIDTTAQALNIKNSQIRELTQIRSSLVAENLKLKRTVDENNKLIYHYKDKYLELAYTPPIDSTGDGSVNLTYDAQLDYTRYTKGGVWPFKPKSNYIAISSPDKRMTIKGNKSLIIKESPKKVSLALQTSSMYDFSDNSFGVGPAAHLGINRFNIHTRYLRDMGDGKWNWMLAGSYDLIKF